MATMRRGACPCPCPSGAPDRIPLIPRGAHNADSAAGMNDFRRRRRPCPSKALLVSSLAVAALPVEGWVCPTASHSPNLQYASSLALEPAHSTLARRIQLRDSLLSSSTTTLFAEDSNQQRRNLEDDISKRLSISQDRSQSPPPVQAGSKRSGNQNFKSKRWRASFQRSGPGGSSDRMTSDSPSPRRSPDADVLSEESSRADRESSPQRPGRKRILQHGPRQSSETYAVRSRRRGHQKHLSVAGSNVNSAANHSSPFSSLLPPPLKSSTINENDARDDPLSSGLSSWEEFLGVGLAEASTDDATPSSVESPSSPQQFLKSPAPLVAFTRGGTKAHALRKQQKQRSNSSSHNSAGTITKSILDAIPRPEALPSIQDLFPPDPSQTAPSNGPQTKGETVSDASSSKTTSLDGVAPVSDLFYRSPPRVSDDQELSNPMGKTNELLSNGSAGSNSKASNVRQSVTTRNPGVAKQQQQPQDVIAKKALAKKKSGRKMIRRGMEMLVGGVPINADPPQRCVELTYDDSSIGSSEPDWARTISLSTLDFGPILHTPSIPHVTAVERGLYCEYFCHSALKWDVCPKDLRDIVRSHTRQYLGDSARPNRVRASRREADSGPSTGDAEELAPPTHDEEDDEYNEIMAIQVRDQKQNTLTSSSNERGSSRRKNLPKANGFGKASSDAASSEERQFYVAVTEISFNLTVAVADLEAGDCEEKGDLFKVVLAMAFKHVTSDNSQGFTVEVSKLILTDKGNGTTNVDVEYKLANERPMMLAQVQKRLKGISASFLQAVDDDTLMVSMAAFAKFQSRWPLDVRGRVADACLQEEVDGTDELPDESVLPAAASSDDELQRPMKSANRRSHDELYIGGGVDGVFPDYSETNIFNAPFHGELGLRLVEAVTQRAKERVPRVIAIGDVHGCIDELQDLLRQCDYRPGDLVVFLGDLICKGPDSISVVQMAREIGAIGVRGNHDFEVIRWHQAIRSGVDPPVVGSEHFHIASCLTKADMKWLYSLPWYMSSKELGALFVHAGFVSGIRLAKQNPRLMMNMRSILPDGTVTSKFFNNWPWARLWDGPQTVLFGHDADRGLQLYEHAIGLDTGCVYGGRLTACILPEKKLVSVSARREYFKYRRKHYD